MSQTIILAMPYLYGLDYCIEKNLRHYGYEVVNLCYDDRHSYYPSLAARLRNLYHKHITKDGNYKKKLKFSRHQAEIEHKLAALHEKADFALCIRANIYPKEVIAQIRQHSRTCINYQWDGIDRFPDILQYLPYFDRFYVFDQSDAEKYRQYGFQAITNFYFDFPIEAAPAAPAGIYFLGGYEANREAETRLFIDTARCLNLPLDFYIYSKDERAEKAFGQAGITYLNQQSALTFEQNLQKVQQCEVVVDFVSPDHQGLSFRLFDALRFDKKVITTNQAVTHYDFYRPENIFVWDGRNLDGLTDFLKQPYVHIAPEIKNCYSFQGWLKQVLSSAVMPSTIIERINAECVRNF